MNNVYLFLLLILQLNIHSYDIYAVVETPQMPVNGDADDPAIWINELDKSNSLIFGTDKYNGIYSCLLYTSPSPRDKRQSRMPSSA